MNPEDYVSYPLALALKKAGFDEPCHYGYSVKMRLEPEISFGDPKMVHSKTPKNYNDNRKGIAKGLEFCSAVPLWQAQKWLRERKKLHCQVLLNGVRTMYFWQIRELVGNGKHAESKHQYEIYEDALSDCLKAALKLLDNEKE